MQGIEGWNRELEAEGRRGVGLTAQPGWEWAAAQGRKVVGVCLPAGVVLSLPCPVAPGAWGPCSVRAGSPSLGQGVWSGTVLSAGTLSGTRPAPAPSKETGCGPGGLVGARKPGQPDAGALGWSAEEADSPWQ